MIPSKRILTRKSKIRFGKWSEYTVQRMLDLGKRRVLVSYYFKYSSIDYQPEILDELRINKEHRIEKPNIDYDKYELHLKEKGVYFSANGDDVSRRMSFRPETFTKGSLQKINHRR